MITVVIAPNFRGLGEAADRGQVESRCIKSLLLVRRFELQHKRLPGTRKKAFQDANAGPVPDDLYSGDKLKYRVLDGTIRAYTTRSDQKDDGGEVDWNFGQQPGDFILQIPVRH